jgi:hypothetical protein
MYPLNPPYFDVPTPKLLFTLIQSEMILERHLKIDAKLSADDLVNMTSVEGGVRMLRGMGQLTFSDREDEDGENYASTCDVASDLPSDSSSDSQLPVRWR